MAFDISFDKESRSENMIHGTIIIGDFIEPIDLPLNYWSLEDYVQQWIDALKRILSGQHGASGLFTEIYDPHSSKYAAMCWSMYRVDNKVFIQNYYQPMDKLDEDLKIEDLYQLIPSRQNDASEWEVSIQELEDFLAKLQSK